MTPYEFKVLLHQYVMQVI